MSRNRHRKVADSDYRPTFREFFPHLKRGDSRIAKKAKHDGDARDANIDAWRTERGLSEREIPA